MSKNLVRVLAVLLSFMLVAAGCKSDAAESNDNNKPDDDVSADQIDYDALGLWDDGPCDTEKPELKLGLITVFESPVISLEDQALALEASATAFNARGGANGSCIVVFTCDDGASVDKAVACGRELDEDGVVATVNEQSTAGQADLAEVMLEAGIPRVATNVTPGDWGESNVYPTDASGTGLTFMLPQAMADRDVTDVGLIRVNLAEAAVMPTLLGQIYESKGLTFPYDAPVPEGTTDFSQFILGADDAGVGGILLALGEQEALQILRAGEQLDTDLVIGASLGSFSHENIADLGDFATQMQFVWSFPPATVDIPVYAALRQDLAASGEEGLQPLALKASPMRSWIGLYALLKTIRDAELTDFTRESITSMLDEATDVPMLGIFGDEDWTPATDHEGLMRRAGTNHWASYRWDPEADTPLGGKGNFVQDSEINFDAILCGSPLGAPGPC